jgi:membrane protein implicated in regulation of membrane protease activity
MEALYWLIAVAVLLLIEILTLGLTTVWFAGGALIAFFLSLAHGSFYLQMAAFILVSFLLLLFTRPVALKYFNKNRAKTNVDALIGTEGIVLEEINNAKRTGRVDVNSKTGAAERTTGQHPGGNIRYHYGGCRCKITGKAKRFLRRATKIKIYQHVRMTEIR